MTSGSTDRPGDLADRVVAALERLARAERGHRRAVAAGHGLSALQADLLTTLARGAPPQPLVGLLALELGVAQPTVTDSIRVLEGKGLVVRLTDPDDRRRTAVALTRQGARRAADVLDSGDELSHAVRSLPLSMQEATLEALLTLIARLVAAGMVDVTRTCLTCLYYEPVGGRNGRCTLLGQPLAPADLRVDCPEHQSARSV